MRRPARYTISRIDQLQAIVSPVRQEILTILEEFEQFAVRELAEHLGRPVESVYYHVHQLVKVGLVESVGSRPGTTRPETLYQVVARRLSVDRENPSPRYQQVLKKAVHSALLFADRLAQRAFDDDRGVLGGPDANFQVRQRSARLSKSKLRELAAMLAEVDRFLVENNDLSTETSYVVTTAYAPVLRGAE